MTRIPGPDELQQHARDLARAFNVRLIEARVLRPEEALALAHLRVALVSPIVDETTYAVALHELGHLAAPTGALRSAQHANSNLQRDEEDAAWTWARHYALVWTAPMDAVARWAEGTYAPAPPVPAAPVKVPPPDRIDWTTAKKRRP